MQTPSTSQIRTAIEVRKKYGEHSNHSAVNKWIVAGDSQRHDQQPWRIEAETIEQTVSAWESRASALAEEWTK